MPAAQPIILHALPGWGFNTSVFDVFSNPNFTVSGIDYAHINANNLQDIAQNIHSNTPHIEYLIGWSLGGLIALHLSQLLKHRLKKLILISSQPSFIQKAHRQGMKKDDALHFLQRFETHPQQTFKQFISLAQRPGHARLPKHAILPSDTPTLPMLLQSLITEDLFSIYKKIHCPILHLVNEKDAILPQNVDQLNSSHNTTQAVAIKNANHTGFVGHKKTYEKIMEEFIFS